MIPIVHHPAAIFVAHAKRRGIHRRRFAAQGRINAMEKAHQLRIQIEIVRTQDIDDRYADVVLEQRGRFGNERARFSGRSLFDGLTISMAATRCQLRRLS